MRKRNKPWMEDELNNSEKLVTNPEELKGKWSTFFGNANPIYLEIGCGKGQFSINSSAKNPDINYIAFDKELQVIGAAVKKCRIMEEELKRSLSIAFVIGDVSNLHEYFDTLEISRLYINFCDPWRDREKWKKRRLTHRNFLRSYNALLGEDAQIFFKTDNTPLFEFSLNEFLEEDWILRNVALDLHRTDFHINGENVMTEYEEKFSLQGMNIYRLEAYRKRPADKPES